jgi:uncharacterized protein
MLFADRLTLDAPKRTSDGYMAVRAKAARTGVYQYTGREVDPDNRHGLRDQASVNVLRDAADVFAEQSVRSFLMKPVTNDHPSVAVTASNWRDHARGVAAGAMRDGDHLAFDLILMDQAAIADVDAGKRELSNGYTCELQFGDFTAADGTKCAAKQTNIRGNHIALVDRGRAGSECRIADAAPCDALPTTILNDGESIVTTKTITFDGLPLLVTDAAEAAIGKLQAQIATLTTAKDAAETSVATLTADKATLTGDKARLEQQLADAKLTPQQLRDAAKNYAVTVGKAKALGVTVTDAMDEPAIMKAVVTAKVGDASKDFDDKQVAACFAGLTKDTKVVERSVLDDAIAGQPINISDAAAEAVKAHDARMARFANGHAAHLKTAA